MFNGLLLKVDPPDPAWRSLAIREAMPKIAVGRCPVRRRCAAIQKARSRLADARRAVAERQEALAVASNRFGNAVGSGDRAMQALHALKGAIGFDSLIYDDRIGKVSLIGAGMRSHPGVTAKFFNCLAEAGVNIGGMQVSRDRKGGQALVALSVDSAVPAEVLEQIRVAIRAERVRAIDL